MALFCVMSHSDTSLNWESSNFLAKYFHFRKHECTIFINGSNWYMAVAIWYGNCPWALESKTCHWLWSPISSVSPAWVKMKDWKYLIWLWWKDLYVVGTCAIFYWSSCDLNEWFCDETVYWWLKCFSKHSTFEFALLFLFQTSLFFSQFFFIPPPLEKQWMIVNASNFHLLHLI